MTLACSLFLLLSLPLMNAVEVSPLLMGYITAGDKSLMKSFFESFPIEAKLDIAKVYHIVLGLASVGVNSTDGGYCALTSGPAKTPEAAFYRASIARITGSAKCKVSSAELQELKNSKLNGTPSAEDVFHIVMAMRESKVEVDKDQVIQMLNKIKTKDTTAPTMAYIFQTVARLPVSKSSLKPFVDAIGDVLDQGDELNGNQLFYDRGLFTTAMVAKGISDLIDSYGEMGGVSERKLVKLLNFLYMRRHSTNLRAAAYLAASLKAFSSNSVLIPAAFLLGSEAPSNLSERVATGGELFHGSSKLQLRIVSLWGDILNPSKVSLTAHGLYAIQGPNKVRTLTGSVKRGSFSSPNGTSHFELSLASVDGALPTPNLYELELSAVLKNEKDKQKLIGVNDVRLPLRVLAKVKIVDSVLKIGDGARENYQSEIKLKPDSRTTASGPNGSIPVEIGQRLMFSARLVDDLPGQTPLTAHQAFVQFTHLETQQSITFTCVEVATVGIANAKAYQLKLDPEGSADDFDNLDGIYKLEFLVGDKLFVKSLIWHVADLDLHFSGPYGADSNRRVAEMNDVSRLRIASPAGMKRSGGVNPLIGTGPTKSKPGIEHVFRPPERRAARPLALAFTALCALPFLGLLISWSVIGINLWNFHFSLSAIIFHAGFIAILTLYYVYWRYLDMFTTLGYLSLIGVPTFLAGNSVLRTQLSARQAALAGGNRK